jgi:hypothetical protein
MPAEPCGTGTCLHTVVVDTNDVGLILIGVLPYDYISTRAHNAPMRVREARAQKDRPSLQAKHYLWEAVQ